MPTQDTNLKRTVRWAASRTCLRVGTLALTIVLMASVDAHAYIDPGTGSYLFQLALAGLLAEGYAVRRYWRTIRFRLASLFGRANPAAGRAHEDDHVH